jgi:hypothetical protein
MPDEDPNGDSGISRKSSIVHGKGVEPLRLAAAEPKADRESHENSDIRQIREIDDARSDEIERVDVPVGQSSGNPDGRVAALQAAIDRLTRVIATADDQTIPHLVTERRAMRDELSALLNQANAP